MASAVYMLTSPSGKAYIGQSIDVDNRMRAYKTKYATKQLYLHAALNKYGFENFKLEYLYKNDTPHQRERFILDAIEKYAIKKYNTTDSKIGYNLRVGGTNGYSHSKETATKIGDAQRGELNHRFGKKNTEEWKLQASNRMKNATYNLKYLDRSKIDQTKHLTAVSRKIYQYGLDGLFIKEWSSQRLAERTLGLTKGAISVSFWRYKKDVSFYAGFLWSKTKEEKVISPKIDVNVGVSVYDMDGSLIKRYESIASYRKAKKLINTEVAYDNGKIRFISYGKLLRAGLIDGIKHGPRYRATVDHITLERQSRSHIGHTAWNKGIPMRESSKLKMLETKRLKFKAND